MTMLRRAVTRLFNTRVGLFFVRSLIRPKGIFLCYPVEQRFADHFCSRTRQRSIPWTPYLVGLIRQGNSFSVSYAISSSEQHFADCSNLSHLRQMTERMNAMAEATGATRIAYAGVLPTVLRARRLVRTSSEVEVTCQAIGMAVMEIIEETARSLEAIVVLGGRGHIGRSLVKHMTNIRRSSAALPRIISVDKEDDFFDSGPSLYINCTRPGVIEEFSAKIPPASIVLNEVYPAPPLSVVQALHCRGIETIHLAGVRGRAWPPFPSEYMGAIPCCAALPDEKIEVVLKHFDVKETSFRRARGARFGCFFQEQ